MSNAIRHELVVDSGLRNSNPAELNWVEIGSPEYKEFIRRIEGNFQSSAKLSACCLCWGFITYNQKKNHQEHSHYTVTSTFFKNEDTFLNLAKQNRKLEDRRVALFAERCQIISGSYTAPPSRSQNFGTPNATKSSQSLTELKAISLK